MKKDAFYFPHDSNAKDDPKVVMMIEQLGLESYGIFWVLVEILRDQPEFKYPLALLPAIARRYNTTSEKVKAVVMNYGLFKTHGDEFFFSESLNTRMMPMLEKKQQAQLAAMTRWNKHKQITDKQQDNADAMQAHSDSSATAMPKRREKKRKEESIRELNIPIQIDFLKYAIENQPDVNEQSVILKYKAWVENGWRDGNDKPIKNWKTKLLNTLPHLPKDASKAKKQFKPAFAGGYENDFTDV